jgi:hypothetical protein
MVGTYEPIGSEASTIDLSKRRRVPAGALRRFPAKLLVATDDKPGLDKDREVSA